MNKLIAAVATPVYPSPLTAKDKLAVNKAAKTVLLERFPGAEIVYDGLSDGAKAPPRIRFYAKVDSASEAARALLAATGGRRPTCAKGFAGAFLVDVNANGVISTAVAGLSAADLAGKTLAQLIEIGAPRGIKIAKGTSKTKAITALLGFDPSAVVTSSPTPEAATEPTPEVTTTGDIAEAFGLTEVPGVTVVSDATETVVEGAETVV